MKKIFLIFPDEKEYLVGFSSSLKSWLSCIKDDLTNIEKYEEGEYEKVRCYHNGQNQTVVYSAKPIRENDRCFMSGV